MKYNLILYGKKTKGSWYGDAAKEYEKRLSRYCKVDVLLVRKEKDWEKRWLSEEDRILVTPGKDSLSSEAFSERIGEWEMKGRGRISFFLPDYSEQTAWYEKTVKEEPGLQLFHLSDFELKPSLCGVILLEQIYRAYRILQGHPYHK